MFTKNLFAKMLLVVVIGSSAALPAFAFASSWTTPNIWPTGFWGPLVSCTGNYLPNGGGQLPANGSTPSPCTSLCDLIDTFINIVYFGISLAVFIIAPVMLGVGGVMIMMAGANPEMLGSGKKALTAAVIGVIIVLCSYLIVNTVITVLNISGVNLGTATCSTS